MPSFRSLADYTKDKLVRAFQYFPLGWLGKGKVEGTPQNEYLSKEKIRQVLSVQGHHVRFLPYADRYTEETDEIRKAYPVMLRDPYIKQALCSKVFGVASLDLQMHPASKSPRDKDIAEFVKHCIQKCKGGTRKAIMNVAIPGAIFGHSVTEINLRQPTGRGQFGDKITLASLKSKDVNKIQLEGDEFGNINYVRDKVTNQPYHASNFLIYTHMPLFELPTGMSDFRAAYRAYWLADTAWQLRAIGLERFGLPVIKGTYKSEDQQYALEKQLPNLRSQGWITVPDGALVEAMDIAARGTTDFESAIRDLREEMVLAIAGAILQMLTTTGTAEMRGSADVQKGTFELLQWYLSQEVADVLNDQLFPQLVDLNYRGADYPTCTFGGVSDSTMKDSITVDQFFLQNQLPLSKEEMYEKYGRQQPLSQDDAVTGPQQQPQMPFGGGGAMGGAPGMGQFAEDPIIDQQATVSAQAKQIMGIQQVYAAGKIPRSAAIANAQLIKPDLTPDAAAALFPLRQALPDGSAKFDETFAERWITIGGKKGEDGKKKNGGKRVIIDDQTGEIKGGKVPKEWQGKKVGEKGTYSKQVKAKRGISKAESAKAKEPWEMTSDEWRAGPGKGVPTGWNSHENEVQQALEDGKSVPRHVAKEYDALTAQYQPHILTKQEFRSATGRQDRLSVSRAQAEAVDKNKPTKGLPSAKEESDTEHLAAVKSALASGKPVPPEVLADYPDLQPKAKPTKPAFTLPDWMKDDPTAKELVSRLGWAIDTNMYIGSGTITKINPPSGKYPHGSVVVTARSQFGGDSKGGKKPEPKKDTFDFVFLRDRLKKGEASWSKTQPLAITDGVKEIEKKPIVKSIKPPADHGPVTDTDRQHVMKGLEGSPVHDLGDLRKRLSHVLPGSKFDKAILDLADSRKIQITQDADPARWTAAQKKQFVREGDKVYTNVTRIGDSPNPSQSSRPKRTPIRGRITTAHAFKRGSKLAEFDDDQLTNTGEHVIYWPDIRQNHSWDCGPAEIVAAGRFAGVAMPPVDYVARECGSHETQDTTPGKLVRMLRTYGIECEPKSNMGLGGLRSHLESGHPVIVHVTNWDGEDHYIAIIGLGGGMLDYHDPDGGYGRIAESEFARHWNGVDRFGIRYPQWGVAIKGRRGDGPDDAQQFDDGPRNSLLADAPHQDTDNAIRIANATQQNGIEVIAKITEEAVARLARSANPTQAVSLYTMEERQQLADALASTLATADLLGRARTHIRAEEVRKKGEGFKFSEPTSFQRFDDDPSPNAARVAALPPSQALAYFMSLTPTITVAPTYAADVANRAFTLAGVTETSVLQRVKDVIKGRLETGQAFRAAPKEIQQVLDEAGVSVRNPQYSEMVFRTNMIGSYNRGSMDAMRDPDVVDLFPVWQYHGIRDGRQRLQHQAHFGRYFANDLDFENVRDHFYDGEFSGWNCRCTQSPVSKWEWEKLLARGEKESRLGDYPMPVG